MERTDWLDEGLDPADARFLMLTAITHHQFSSPIWGDDEVRKLHAELAEFDVLAAKAAADHSSAWLLIAVFASVGCLLSSGPASSVGITKP